MSQAIVVARTGGPEVMQLAQRHPGAPGTGQVLIRQTAIGVNFIDIYQRSGLYPLPLPFVPGNEGVGLIVGIGDGVSGFKVGQRVTYQGQPGAYAEERLLPADRAIAVPDGVDDRTVAAMMLKGMTAYYLLFKTWAVGPGQTILYHAAAGGVGLIACQWAKALGARVIGTAGSVEKLALAEANGCDVAINYRTEDFVKRVKDLTGGRGVDVVYDGVGKDTFENSLDCLRPRGLMVSFGNASGVVSIPDIGVLSRKGSLYITRPTGVHYYARREDMLEGANALFDAVRAGTIRIEISKTYPLSDAADVHRALEGRATTGSVVLVP